MMAWCVGALCHAQLLPDDSLRLGTKDPRKARELYDEVWNDPHSPILQGNEAMPISLDFYIRFKQLTGLAPYSSFYFFNGHIYEHSTSMYPRLLESTTDPAIRMMLVEDVMAHGDMYVDRIDSINVLRSMFAETRDMPLTMAMAKIRRAHYNYLFAHSPEYYPSRLYDRQKVYELYREAFEEFLASRGDQGKELHAYYVQEYYKVCEDLYKSDEEKYYEQFLSDYQEIVKVCDKLLIPCYDVPDSIKWDPNTTNEQYRLFQQYMSAAYGIDPATGDTIGVKLLFANSGAASADRLRAYYAPRLEANRQDKEFLDSSIRFMMVNGLSADTVLYDYCMASYALGKTYENCIGLANSAYAGLIGKANMREYMLEALHFSPSKEMTAQILFAIARSLYTARPDKSVYGKDTEQYRQWEKDMRDCNANLELMLEYSPLLLASPSLDVRDYVAQAYYMLGENHLRLAEANISMPYAEKARDYFTKAGELKVNAAHINRRPVAVLYGDKGKLMAVSNCIQQIRQIHRNARKAAADKAYWERSMAEHDAVRRFWQSGINRK